MTVEPIEKDALDGPDSIEIFGGVAAGLGGEERAIAALQRLLSMPYSGAMGGPLTPALLRLDPFLDPLRADRRFEKLAASDTPNKTEPQSRPSQ